MSKLKTSNSCNQNYTRLYHIQLSAVDMTFCLLGVRCTQRLWLGSCIVGKVSLDWLDIVCFGRGQRSMFLDARLILQVVGERAVIGSCMAGYTRFISNRYISKLTEEYKHSKILL